MQPPDPLFSYFGVQPELIHNHTASLPSGQLNYVVYNPQGQRDILMLHGFRGNHRGLLPLASRLGYRAIIPDLPGMGASPALPGFNGYDEYAELLEQFCAQLNFNGPILAHSFGTLPAIRLVQRQTEQFTALILLNPVARPDWRTRLAGAYYLPPKLLPDKLAKAWLTAGWIQNPIRRATMTTSDPNLRRIIMDEGAAEMAILNPRVHIENFLATLRCRPDQWIKQISTQTLIIAGKRDLISPLGAVRRSFPGGNYRLEVVDQLGHFSHCEHLDITVPMITGWLNSAS